jgi:SAM-dependent methyltransferase
MNVNSNFGRSLALASGLVLMVVAVAGQAQQAAKPFEPVSGQAGKDVVWVPTPQQLVDKFMEVGKVTSADILYDLGSGDGRTVITAAKLGAKAFGIEYNPEMVALSKRNAEKEGVTANATFTEGDIFKSDFSKATVLTLFLLPELNVRLRPTILNMKPGTRVLSNSFDMGDWEADQKFEVGTTNCSSWCRGHFWIVPAKVEGTWKMGDTQIELKQTYQNVTGTVKTGNVVAPITAGKLTGDSITFTAGGTTYTGKVSGNRIEGTAGAAKFEATKG